MARRSNSHQRNSGRHTSNPKPYPQDAPPKTVKPPRKSRFDFILVAALAVLLYFIISPLIKPSQATVITNENGNEIVDLPVISEVMSANRDALAAEDGEYYDWIEVYNPTENNINLAGFSLTDDLEQPAKYVFSTLVLAPGEFAVVYASGGAIEDNPMHASFKISSSGEDLYLCDPHSNVVDQVAVPHLSPDISYQRVFGQPDAFVQTEAYTPGYYNDEAGYNAFMESRRVYDSPIKISEVMSSNLITIADCDGDYSDWVELKNEGQEAISLAGYGLSDNQTSPREWTFPDGTVLYPGEYLLVFLSGKDKVSENWELHASFSLNSLKDSVVLSNVQGQILDYWIVENLLDDTSMGKVPSDGTAAVFTHPTPGYPNTEDGYNAFQQSRMQSTGPLIISEVLMGNSDTELDGFLEPSDYIELYNSGEEDIALGGYGLTDCAKQIGKWKFPDDVVIKAGEYMLVWASGRDTIMDKEYHTNFSLDATGEPVVLSSPQGEILDVCKLAPMPYDVSYGRALDGNTFEYMLYPSPRKENGTGWPGFAETATLGTRGGSYEEGSVVISINVPEGTTVHYTTDCEDPDENSPVYSGPFEITETTVVKARSYENGKLPGTIVTQTYFINVDHTLPIVSITSDPYNIDSDTAGIYAFGDDYSRTYPFSGANFNQDWEVPAYVEMYEIDGSQVLDQGIGLRIFGAYSRAEIAKSFTLVARSQYGPETLEHAIFPDLPYDSYKSVILRNGASVWYTNKIADSLLTSLVHDTTDLAIQAYYPAVVYLNSEYWGVYFFREKINKYYLQYHYGMDPENVDIIYGNGTSSRNALAGTNEDWLALKNYVETHDLSNSEYYSVVENWVDIKNYIDYVICEIYVGNTDTGNIKQYREKTEDGKWRWMFYDVDWSFISRNLSSNNIEEYINPDGHGVGNSFDTWLICGLMNNEGFKKEFIERFAYHITVTFAPERVAERANEIAGMIDAEMPLDRETWNTRWEAMPDWYKSLCGRAMGYTSWKRNVEGLKSFAQSRPDIVIQQLKEFFNLSQQNLIDLGLAKQE